MRKISYSKPGEILLEEFLKPMNISAYRLACGSRSISGLMTLSGLDCNLITMPLSRVTSWLAR